jgi:hypothetical protein
MNKIIIKYLSIILLITLAESCGKEEQRRADMIDSEVKTLLDRHVERRKKECLAALMDTASRIADSLIVAKMTKVDSSIFIGRPEKPVKPIIKSPLDTTPVVPLVPIEGNKKSTNNSEKKGVKNR